jgi:hypothetical protein
MFEIEKAYIDINAIEEGRWVPLGAEFPEVEVFTRGMTCAPARRMRDKLRREAPRSERMRNGLLSPEAEDRILKEVIGQVCITDWRGLASGGKPLPFSRETLASILTEPRARALAAAFVGAVIDLETRTGEAQEEVAGNSPAP